MANDLNQCNFIGRLAADPDTRYLPSGEPVCNFRIAVGWKSRDKEGAEWVNIVAFTKLAEICTEYLTKGSQVMVTGRMRTREWEKDGVKRYTTEIVAERMQMFGGKPEGSPKGDGGKGYQAAREGRQQQHSGGFDDIDDRIPF
jgi:single-strand DNA-binding protein